MNAINFKHSIIFFNLCILISPFYLIFNYEPIIICLFIIKSAKSEPSGRSESSIVIFIEYLAELTLLFQSLNRSFEELGVWIVGGNDDRDFHALRFFAAEMARSYEAI